MNNILVFQLQELRLLKNFSSLKAIISGLQSNPIYRLKRAWSYVLREKLEIFEELARIFSGENNALAQRELLVREGTARFADTVGENDHHMQKILQKHSENSRVRTNFLQIFQFVWFFLHWALTIRKCKKMARQNTFEILLLNDANIIGVH